MNAPSLHPQLVFLQGIIILPNLECPFWWSFWWLYRGVRLIQDCPEMLTCCPCRVSSSMLCLCDKTSKSRCYRSTQLGLFTSTCTRHKTALQRWKPQTCFTLYDHIHPTPVFSLGNRKCCKNLPCSLRLQIQHSGWMSAFEQLNNIITLLTWYKKNILFTNFKQTQKNMSTQVMFLTLFPLLWSPPAPDTNICLFS